MVEDEFLKGDFVFLAHRVLTEFIKVAKALVGHVVVELPGADLLKEAVGKKLTPERIPPDDPDASFSHRLEYKELI